MRILILRHLPVRQITPIYAELRQFTPNHDNLRRITTIYAGLLAMS